MPVADELAPALSMPWAAVKRSGRASMRLSTSRSGAVQASFSWLTWILERRIYSRLK